MKRALTIAGFDPSGYAGLVADLMTFWAMGVEGVSAVTAITVQDRRAIKGFKSVDAKLLTSQVETVLRDMPVDAVKIGMLGSAANARAVARIFSKRRFRNIVLDPVFRSSSGYPLIDEGGISAIKKLLNLASVVTPNLYEAAALTGGPVKGLSGMEEAAKTIHGLGPRAVVIKGGHMKGQPLDVLYNGKRFYHFEGRRIKGGARRMHGTGCIFSAAIAAGLARGFGVKKAVEGAKAYLEKTLKERR
jgi:hydroxymethylpyrimidine/phosphomethylpyrimidine kinase